MELRTGKNDINLTKKGQYRKPPTRSMSLWRPRWVWTPCPEKRPPRPGLGGWPPVLRNRLSWSHGGERENGPGERPRFPGQRKAPPVAGLPGEAAPNEGVLRSPWRYAGPGHVPGPRRGGRGRAVPPRKIRRSGTWPPHWKENVYLPDISPCRKRPSGPGDRVCRRCLWGPSQRSVFRFP